MRCVIWICIIVMGVAVLSPADQGVLPDNLISLHTDKGQLEIVPVYHGTVLFKWTGLVTVVDPYRLQKGYPYPRADVILITHDHPDHYDWDSIKRFIKASTIIVAPKNLKRDLAGKQKKVTFMDVLAMKNGDQRNIGIIGVTAVPAYNIFGRQDGVPYHPRGKGNGYLLDFGGRIIYVAGDTEMYKGMADFGKVDVAFLPILPPYTMSESDCVDVLKMIRPSIFVPYHYQNPFGGRRQPALRSLSEKVSKLGIETRLVEIY